MPDRVIVLVGMRRWIVENRLETGPLTPIHRFLDLKGLEHSITAATPVNMAGRMMLADSLIMKSFQIWNCSALQLRLASRLATPILAIFRWSRLYGEVGRVRVCVRLLGLLFGPNSVHGARGGGETMVVINGLH